MDNNQSTGYTGVLLTILSWLITIGGFVAHNVDSITKLISFTLSCTVSVYGIRYYRSKLKNGK